MAPLARGEVYLGSCSGWLILMPGIPWIDLRCGGWRLPSDELKARRLWRRRRAAARLPGSAVPAWRWTGLRRQQGQTVPAERILRYGSLGRMCDLPG